MRKQMPDIEISLEELRARAEDSWSVAAGELWSIVWSGVSTVLSQATNSEMEEFVSSVIHNEIVPEILCPRTLSFKKAKTFADIKRLSFSIGKKRAVDEVRRLVVRSDPKNKEMIRESVESADFERDLIRAERILLVQRAVENLPRRSREVIQYFYLEEKNAKEIARILDRPVNTVYSDLFVARKHMKRLLSESGIEREFADI